MNKGNCEEAFFDRLITERNELDQRIKSLDFFIKLSPRYKTLPSSQKSLLVDQLSIMRKYLDILNKRIVDIQRDI